MHAKSLWLCPTLCDPMDCNQLVSSAHGILQASMEWMPCPSPGDHPSPGMEPSSMSLALADSFFTTKASWESPVMNRYYQFIKEIKPEYSLEGLILKLKLQYFGHMMQRASSLEKILVLGKTEGRGGDRRWDGWMASPTQWT